MKLREYQERLIGDIRSAYSRGVRSALAVLPTGGGKTVVFSAACKMAAEKQRYVTIVAHRQELLEQISGTLNHFGVKHGVVSPRHPLDRSQKVQVASVLSLKKRLDIMHPADLLIIDEAHHAVSDTAWGDVASYYKQARVLGVTATPVRLSGEPLSDVFDEMILGPSMRDLIDAGQLSDYTIFAPPGVDTDGIAKRGGDFVRSALAAAADKPSITGDAVQSYIKHCQGKRAVVFCVSVEHAEHVAAQFSESGIPAKSLDGKLHPLERAGRIEQFKRGALKIITSCDLISEGFDLPAIEAAVLLRPTQSLGLYLQQVGRALRLFPGKDRAIILDHAGNWHRHGLPDDEREWSLDGQGSSGKSGGTKTPIKTCSHCFAVNPAHASSCFSCDTKFVVKSRQVEQVAGDLEEVDTSIIRMQRAREQASARTEQELIELGRRRGYKRPELWARHVFRARRAA